MAHLRLEFKKLCMVRMYAYVEEILVAAKDVERVLAKLDETPFELLKENKRKG